MSNSWNIKIDADGIEVELEVDIDGEQYEAPSMEGPGSPGGVWVEEARFETTGNIVPEIFFEKHFEQMNEKLAEAVEETNEEAKLDHYISREQDMEDYYDARYGDGPY